MERPGYDAWRLAYPPWWDEPEPEPKPDPCVQCDDEGEFEDEGRMIACPCK